MGVVRLQIQAVTESDATAAFNWSRISWRFSGATFSGCSPASRPASSAASVPRLKWAEAASPLSCARPAFKYHSRACATSPLRCAAHAWSNAAIAALAASAAVELLTGCRETVTRLVEFALAIPAQSLANRLGRIVGPADSGESRNQNERRGDGHGGLTGSGRELPRVTAGGLEFPLRGTGPRRRRDAVNASASRASSASARKIWNWSARRIRFWLVLVAAAPALKVFRVQFSQIVGAGAHGNIDAGRLERDFLEQRAVQLAPHLLPLVLDVRLGFGSLRYPRAVIGVAQADGEDRDMTLGGDRRRLEGIRLLVVAIGDQQDRLIAVGPGLKDFEGLANGVADGRAAPRRAPRVELVERSAEGVVIDRERALHHRLPRKGDQAHAFPFEPVDEGRHVGLRAPEPAGRDVLGQHRPRDVDQHVKIAARGG